MNWCRSEISLTEGGLTFLHVRQLGQSVPFLFPTEMGERGVQIQPEIHFFHCLVNIARVVHWSDPFGTRFQCINGSFKACESAQTVGLSELSHIDTPRNIGLLRARIESLVK